MGGTGWTLADVVDSHSLEFSGSVVELQSTPVAVTVDGVDYLFIKEMAAACGVSVDQLRHWDRKGDLPADGLGEISPSHKFAWQGRNWRVYPHTNEKIEQIQRLAERKKRGTGHLHKDEYSRAQAAQVLDITTRQLRYREKKGEAHPLRKDRGRVVYSKEEVLRLKEGLDEE